MSTDHFQAYCAAVAGTKHSAEWTKDLGKDVEGIVYQQENESRDHYYGNNGNEVGAYLQFILDYYHCLPNVSLSSTTQMKVCVYFESSFKLKLKGIYCWRNSYVTCHNPMGSCEKNKSVIRCIAWQVYGLLILRLALKHGKAWLDIPLIFHHLMVAPSPH